MGLNIASIGSALTTVSVDVGQANAILGKANYFVQVAEAVGGSGSAKLAAVGTALEGFLEETYPAIYAEFAKLWPELVTLISGLVSIYNALGFFTKVTPAAAKPAG